MTSTRIRDLVGIAAIATALSWFAVRQWYGELPELQWFVPLSLGLLAIAEAIAGHHLRVRIRGRPGVAPVNPLAAARLLALAKASSLVGAAMTGLWAGWFIYAVDRRDYLAAARDDTVPTGIGVVTGLGLVVAAMWLEYCCRTPKPPNGNRHD